MEHPLDRVFHVDGIVCVVRERKDEMQDHQIKEILSLSRRVHMIGASPSPERPSYRVGEFLLSKGYSLFCIRPGSDTVLGQPCYPTLADSPQPVDIVDVFRASEFVPGIVEEAIAVGAKVLWLQEGVTHPEAEQRARDAGLLVVSDRCIKKEIMRLF